MHTKIRRTFIVTLFLVIPLLSGVSLLSSAPGSDFETFKLPEFTQSDEESWFNSTPLSRNDLKGKVVLIDFWTFECWNCYRSFPWLRDLEVRFSNSDFQVIGIHTPEFEHEKESGRVESKIEEFQLHHPVMMDNDFIYWKAMKNRFWPTFYLVDKGGRVRYSFIGETHMGTQKAKAIEKAIELLLSED